MSDEGADEGGEDEGGADEGGEDEGGADEGTGPSEPAGQASATGATPSDQESDVPANSVRPLEVESLLLYVLAGPDELDTSPHPDPFGASMRALKSPVHRSRHLDAIWWNLAFSGSALAFAIAEIEGAAVGLLLPWLVVFAYKSAEVQCRTLATEAGRGDFDHLDPRSYITLAAVISLGSAGAAGVVLLLSIGVKAVFEELGDGYGYDAELGAWILVGPFAWYALAILVGVWGRGLVAIVQKDPGWLGTALRGAARSILRPVSAELRFLLYATVLCVVITIPAALANDSEASATIATVLGSIAFGHIAIAFPIFIAHQAGLLPQEP